MVVVGMFNIPSFVHQTLWAKQSTNARDKKRTRTWSLLWGGGGCHNLQERKVAVGSNSSD